MVAASSSASCVVAVAVVVVVVGAAVVEVGVEVVVVVLVDVELASFFFFFFVFVFVDLLVADFACFCCLWLLAFFVLLGATEAKVSAVASSTRVLAVGDKVVVIVVIGCVDSLGL